MFDVWIGDMNIAPFLWIFTLIVVLPIQLALCFKVKSKIVRLLPVIILSILTLIAAVASATSIDWSALLYLIFAVYLGIMLFVCGIGWGIWAITVFVKKRKQSAFQGGIISTDK